MPVRTRGSASSMITAVTPPMKTESGFLNTRQETDSGGLSAADAVIFIDLTHLPAGPFCRLPEFVLLIGRLTDQVQVRARYAISDEPMSAEEWKKQYVREG